MSETTMFRIEDDGSTTEIACLHNPFRYAMMVWVALCDRYTPGKTPFDADWWQVIDIEMQRAQAPACDILTLRVTFDSWATRGADHLRKVATAFRDFDVRHWPQGHAQHGKSHLPAMADEFDRQASADAYGVCIWTTSTTDNPWEDYNFHEQNDHVWVEAGVG